MMQDHLPASAEGGANCLTLQKDALGIDLIGRCTFVS